MQAVTRGITEVESGEHSLDDMSVDPPVKRRIVPELAFVTRPGLFWLVELIGISLLVS